MGEQRLGALIPAAGHSSRMEGFKPLLHIGGKSLIEHAIGLFTGFGIENVVTVVGYQAEKLIPVVRAASSRYAINKHYPEGMFSSIQQGIKELRHRCDAFFLLPVDIPLVLPATIRKLSDAFSQDPSALVLYPQFQFRRGHPPLINGKLIDEILAYEGQGGLREFLRRYEDQAMVVLVDDPFIRLDVDTREDLFQLRSKYATYASTLKQQCGTIHKGERKKSVQTED